VVFFIGKQFRFLFTNIQLGESEQRDLQLWLGVKYFIGLWEMRFEAKMLMMSHRCLRRSSISIPNRYLIWAVPLKCQALTKTGIFCVCEFLAGMLYTFYNTTIAVVMIIIIIKRKFL
jgi:hypothetical protein